MPLAPPRPGEGGDRPGSSEDGGRSRAAASMDLVLIQYSIQLYHNPHASCPHRGRGSWLSPCRSGQRLFSGHASGLAPRGGGAAYSPRSKKQVQDLSPGADPTPKRQEAVCCYCYCTVEKGVPQNQKACKPPTFAQAQSPAWPKSCARPAGAAMAHVCAARALARAGAPHRGGRRSAFWLPRRGCAGGVAPPLSAALWAGCVDSSPAPLTYTHVHI